MDAELPRRPGEIGWRFDNSYARLPEVLFAQAEAEHFPAPELVVRNDALGRALGIDLDAVPSR